MVIDLHKIKTNNLLVLNYSSVYFLKIIHVILMPNFGKNY